MTLKVHILTLFPEMFASYFGESMLKRAQEAGLVHITTHNIRDYATDKHRTTDDTTYGGGAGMVLKPEPLFAAVAALHPTPTTPIILLTPQGRPFSHAIAQELAAHEEMVLVCGRYEGVDERVREHLITAEISIGDYVLTGGELAAMVVVDAVARLIPGVLGAETAADDDSYATGLLEGAQYTRPEIFQGWAVPAVLRSGHGANIGRWRREQALRRTWQRRPELLLTAVLTEEDKRFLAVLAGEGGSEV